MGDGSTVTCTGPGVEWAPGMPEDATDCSHTYASSSDAAPDGVHLVLKDLKRPLKEGETITLTVVTDGGVAIPLAAIVKPK